MINLYLVDDDLVKVNYFEQILKIIDEHFKVYQCQNGFGANNRNAYLSFDLLDKAIQDKDGFWLLDISMPNSKHIGEKLLGSYVGDNQELLNQIDQLHSIFKYTEDTYLACVLTIILKNKARPIIFISNARGIENRAIRDLEDILDRKNTSRFPDTPYIVGDQHFMPISRDIVAFIRNNRRDRPDQILLDELFNFKSEDLHITEKLKKQAPDDSIFAPIKAISTFLKYPSLYEFNADFLLWKNIDDLSSYGTNMVEETLKSIVAKNASLLSLFLWAWGAFKAITIFDEEELARGNKLFRLALTKTISSYKETKRSTKKASSGDWDPFVRYSSAWAKKSEGGFRDTLSAYIEMFQVLFYNLNSEKASIKRVEISKDNLRFFLDIDGDNLVHRLNTVHQDLIEVFNGQTFYDRHQTSRKILKYWLLSQVSDIDGKDKKEGDKNQWGSDSGFYIQNRNSENSTGITITFSL